MPETDGARECQVFTHYLVGQPATEYIVEKYTRGHRSIPYQRAGALPLIDRYLLGVARSGTIGTRLADGYARFFRPTGALRQKLVLLLAILENSLPYHEWLNRADTGGRFRVLGRIAVSGAAFVLLLGLGLVVIGPVHLVSGFNSGSRGAE